MSWMMLLWPLLLIIPIWLVWQLLSRSPDRPTTVTPEETARLRYARGEISSEELQRILAELRNPTVRH